VQLGSLSNINVGDSLISKITDGNAFLDINPDLAVPPSCPPGQVALSDDQGGWVCTPPNLVGKRNPASKVWVVPKIDRCENRHEEGHNRPVQVHLCENSGDFSELTIMNPGLGSASVSCLFFDSNGALQLDLVQSSILGPGAQGLCNSPVLDPDSTRRYGWALIVSDRAVLPTVRTFWDTYLGRQDEVYSAQIEAYPVDCDDPDGHEFVCQFSE
jgi:hypothetical protein